MLCEKVGVLFHVLICFCFTLYLGEEDAAVYRIT